jgi:hypothetical protein
MELVDLEALELSTVVLSMLLDDLTFARAASEAFSFVKF